MADETLIEKAGRVLSSVNAQAILDAFNTVAAGANKLSEVLQRAGVEQAAEEGGEEEAPSVEGEEKEVVAESDAPPAEEDEEEKEPVEKMVMRPTQAEVNYVSVSTKRGQACANCSWFSAHHHDYDMQSMSYCHLIENWPEDILPTGICDRYEGKPEMPEPAPIPVTIVEAQLKTEKEYTSLIQRFKVALSRKPEPASAFVIFKGLDGKPRWFARYTNNFEDLEGDVFTEKAHDKTIARINAGLIPPPYLTFWHLQGTEHGQAEHVVRDGHTVMAWGTFDETPFTQKCLTFYQKNRGQIKLSLGAFVPKWARSTHPDIRRNVYTDYNAVHITTLPPGLARPANPFTTFSEDMTMALKPEQKALLVKEFGQDEADRIERDNETLNKTLEQLVQFKDFADLVTKAEDKPPAKSDDATLLSLYKDIAEGQALTVKIAETVAKQLQERDTQIATLTKELETVKTNADKALAQLSLTPRRASTDPKTQLTPDEAEQVRKEIPQEIDPFFGDLHVPAKVK